MSFPVYCMYYLYVLRVVDATNSQNSINGYETHQWKDILIIPIKIFFLFYH